MNDDLFYTNTPLSQSTTPQKRGRPPKHDDAKIEAILDAMDSGKLARLCRQVQPFTYSDFPWAKKPDGELVLVPGVIVGAARLRAMLNERKIEPAKEDPEKVVHVLELTLPDPDFATNKHSLSTLAWLYRIALQRRQRVRGTKPLVRSEPTQSATAVAPTESPGRTKPPAVQANMAAGAGTDSPIPTRILLQAPAMATPPPAPVRPLEQRAHVARTRWHSIPLWRLKSTRALAALCAFALLVFGFWQFVQPKHLVPLVLSQATIGPEKAIVSDRSGKEVRGSILHGAELGLKSLFPSRHDLTALDEKNVLGVEGVAFRDGAAGERALFLLYPKPLAKIAWECWRRLAGQQVDRNDNGPVSWPQRNVQISLCWDRVILLEEGTAAQGQH